MIVAWEYYRTVVSGKEFHNHCIGIVKNTCIISYVYICTYAWAYMHIGACVMWIYRLSVHSLVNPLTGAVSIGSSRQQALLSWLDLERRHMTLLEVRPETVPDLLSQCVRVRARVCVRVRVCACVRVCVCVCSVSRPS